MIRAIFASRGTRAVALAAGLCLLVAVTAQAQQRVPKQVHLIEDGTRLVASNVRFSRFDEIRLDARERVRDSEVGEGVIVVVTNQRILAYGAVSGWREIDRNANESIVSLSAEDYAGLVVTNMRLLNFNGETGIWAVRNRTVPR